MNLIDVTYTDPIHGQLHVVVVSPYGGGGNGYHVYVNNYFHGQIVHTSDGWIPYVKLGVLAQDDIDAIVAAVERREG